jgi:hypothetical protein
LSDAASNANYKNRICSDDNLPLLREQEITKRVQATSIFTEAAADSLVSL